MHRQRRRSLKYRRISTKAGGSSAHDLELAHQPVVLVVEHVAVDRELAAVVAEVAGDEDPFAGEDEEGVLEAVFPGRRRLAVAGEQVPVAVVQVHHVGDRGAVVELPDLGRVELREGVGAGRVEGPAVDLPAGLEEAADGDLPGAVGLAVAPPARPHRPLAAAAAAGAGSGSGPAPGRDRPGTASGRRRRRGRRRGCGRRGGLLRSSTDSPAAPAKSTITSARSAGPRRIWLRRTGRGIRPLSLPIWIIGAPLERWKLKDWNWETLSTRSR